MQPRGITAMVMVTAAYCAAESFEAHQGPRSVASYSVGQTFRDCTADRPEMVVVPPGRFTIGSSSTEVGRGNDESPQKIVTIAYALAVAKYPVARSEFAAFGRSAVETCMPRFQNARVLRGGGWNAIPAWLRSASRHVEPPSLRSDTFGFRVARSD